MNHHMSYTFASSTDVHLWCARLDWLGANVEAFLKTLSSDELKRANALQFEAHRKRFIVCRGLLRRIIGRYVGIRPASVQFSYSPAGKPALAENKTSLEFNVSHSGGLALLGFSTGRKIGVDVERYRRIGGLKQIVSDCFSPSEQRIFDALPESQKQTAFFQGWTRKEAYLKASGVGLSRSPKEIEVGFSANRVLRIHEPPATTWSISHVVPSPASVGAVATQGADLNLLFRHWPERRNNGPAERYVHRNAANRFPISHRKERHATKQALQRRATDLSQTTEN